MPSVDHVDRETRLRGPIVPAGSVFPIVQPLIRLRRWRCLLSILNDAPPKPDSHTDVRYAETIVSRYADVSSPLCLGARLSTGETVNMAFARRAYVNDTSSPPSFVVSPVLPSFASLYLAAGCGLPLCHPAHQPINALTARAPRASGRKTSSLPRRTAGLAPRRLVFTVYVVPSSPPVVRHSPATFSAALARRTGHIKRWSTDRHRPGARARGSHWGVRRP